MTELLNIMNDGQKDSNGVIINIMENKLVKILKLTISSIIGIFIVVILIINFSQSKKIMISTQIICMIALLIVLLAINCFDYISIGEIRFIRKENTDLKNENIRLKNEIISIKYSNNQNLTANFYGISVPNEEEKMNNKKEKSSCEERRELNSKLELEAKERFCEENNINIKDLSEIKINVEDPILDKEILIDSYYNDGTRELFIELINPLASPLLIYQLYPKLYRVFMYKKAKNNNVIMIIIVYGKTDEDKKDRHSSNINYLYKVFAPAIKNGILRIIDYYAH